MEGAETFHVGIIKPYLDLNNRLNFSPVATPTNSNRVHGTANGPWEDNKTWCIIS